MCQQRINDLKLKRRQEKRASKSIIQQPIILDELQSNDEWIAKIEEPVIPTGGEWLNELDRAARRFTRQATRDENESSDKELQDNVVEVQTLSDDDDHAEAATIIGSNEIDLDDFGVVDDTDIGGTTTG
uniref:Uncharacterized protein n=1 Tax=Chenopodium quinoa TaxID=63459 RepID=A0A803N8H6_CHEQI